LSGIAESESYFLETALDSIESDVPAEAFIDPVTENPLEYENHGECFSLYGETIKIWPE
jgi:hypothetical protein